MVVCQKSKIRDWFEHFCNNYSDLGYSFLNITNEGEFSYFLEMALKENATLKVIGIINYDLIWRRKDLLKLKDFTLLLDESSLIQNETSKRTKFILKLQCKNVVLLSGTPCGGKYHLLWSQMHLLGWNISKDMYYRQYVDMRFDGMGYPYVAGYKNVDRLKKKMREHGCVFMKTEEVLDLPRQNFIDIRVDKSKEYKKFMKSGIVQVHTGVYDHQCGSEWDGKIYDDLHELVGDTTLTKLLYARQLCGMYSKEKLNAFKDLVDSTEDRLIVFYNFNDELEKLKLICEDRRISVVNGSIKDLQAYNKCDNSITFIQYQAGAMGLNLQLANKIVYFTPPLSSELFEQSKKRIHRIGQEKPCFYYQLKCGIEYHIYDVLSMRKDYTDELFVEVL